MKSILTCTTLLSILCTFAGLPVEADIIDETIVYVECTTTGNPLPRKGSGVVVSANGMVLTAKHVVFGNATDMPPDTICQAAVGNKNRPKSTLVLQSASTRFDAVLLKLPEDGLPFLRYCRLEPSLQRSPIVATGFPLDTRTGVPSSRVGVLSTVQPDSFGLVETDSATTSGMSGGMVTLVENGNLVGIVSGVDPDDATGLPSFYAILAVQVLANEFREWGLSEDPEGCAAVEKVTGPLGMRNGRPWEATDPPLELGVSEDDGVCYIVRVWGDFDHPDDMVEVTAVDGQYVLRGDNGGGGPHGALAGCLRN